MYTSRNIQIYKLHWGQPGEDGTTVVKMAPTPKFGKFLPTPAPRGGGGGWGCTHYVRVMGRLRGIDPPFSRHWEKP